MSDLLRALKPWDADVRRKRALSFVEATIVAVLPLSAILARWNPAVALALAGVWIAAVALAALWPTIPARVARHADRIAGLRAVCDTALHLKATGHPAADAVGLDAVDALGKAQPPAPLRLARPRVLGLAFVAAVLLAIVPKPTRHERAEEKKHDESPVASDLRTLEQTARSRGDLALAEAARHLRTELETAPDMLDVPSSASPTAAPPPAPPPEMPDAPEPVAAVAAPLFPPMAKAPDTSSKWEADPVGKELADDLHDALSKYMSLDKLKNPAITKAKILGGSSPFDDGSKSEASGPAPGTNGGGSHESPSSTHDESSPAKTAQQDFQRGAAGMARRSQVNGHENEVALAHAWNEFLEQYANTIRDRLMDKLEELEKKSQKQSGSSDGPNLGAGGDAKTGGDPSASSDLSATADMKEVSEDAPSMLAKTNQAPNSMKSGGGGTGETSPGGSGAGQGQEGTPVSATPEPASGSGDPDRVRGQFRPGSLSPSEEEALFDALEARASVEGPFEQFGPEVNPYVTEAKQALDSEPTDPRMKSWVESYLRQLAG
jgi:hypothetical protein